ncbi:MAG: DNA mismatch repair protein MutS [Candidatus ainarchaeum sp.]|nr:DNA mismatch repair protein MutS [Candidatus ainarchaeum sp.]MDD3975854.1 DNA mismatch repair protein MutS [Candidatus ainarchaeum sp.]
MNNISLTPMMKQYVETKKKYPEGILLFRAGDFYEMFFDDAKEASRILNITLTKRGKGLTEAPLAGIPYHSIDPYISKLVKSGKKVVICEQMENPKFAKGLVKRDVIRVITPSTLFSDSYENNFLGSISFVNNIYGFSLIDITTGDFKVCEFDDFSSLLNEISSIKPKELLLSKNILKSFDKVDLIKKTLPLVIINYTDDLNLVLSRQKLLDHFSLSSLESFGIDSKNHIIISSSNALNYLKETQFSDLSYIRSIKSYSFNKYLKLDRKTIKNLELINSLSSNNLKNSLFGFINKTKTAMGYRQLYFDLLHPSLDLVYNNNKYDCISEFINDIYILEDLKTNLSYISDIERIISKVGFGNSNPRDLISLKQSLLVVSKIKNILNNLNSIYFSTINNNLKSLDKLISLIDNSIVQDPPFSVREGNFIKPNFSNELYSLVNIHKSINSFLLEYEEKLKLETNIKSLKLKFNKIFGYYIEIPKMQAKQVPNDFERKQTLVNAERFTTKILSEKESLILNAKEKRLELEYNIFLDICKEVLKYQKDILDISKNIGFLDVICSNAQISLENNYFKPKLNNSDHLYFKDLRHPIIEKLTDFVPNDCNLNITNKTMIITGPNMAGKSSYMRSVCISIILAYAGCFIPSNDSEIGFIDAVFTRVGASDDIIHGQSTFLVEMSEVAYILNNATNKSFVILDEVGRGTSTYDGLSLAWSIIEYLNNFVNCKTLVATHYHLLNKMQDLFLGIKNYHVIAKEDSGKLSFYHKLIEGGIDKSYGIQVAKMSGINDIVINRALEIQKDLEEDVFLKSDVSKNILFKNEQKKII